MDKLKCKICGYESKQLFQHLKAVHGMSTIDYRNKYGKNEIVQVGFNPNIKKVDRYNSNYVKSGYKKIENKLNKIINIYNKEKTLYILTQNELWKKYIGKTKYRTLIKDDDILYKSIIEHSSCVDKLLNRRISLPERLKFIVEYNYDTDKLLCYCRKTYTYNQYCRFCDVDRAKWKGKSHKMTTIEKLKKPKSLIGKRNIRLGCIERIEKNKLNGNQLIPNYNPTSISVIEKIAEKYKINDIQHAENGGEFHIKELGYWVDGYSPEKNIVIEIDEKHHFVHGKLRKKDINRQREIEEYLDCKFIRVKL